jgi:hypothetical protein
MRCGLVHLVEIDEDDEKNIDQIKTAQAKKIDSQTFKNRT